MRKILTICIILSVLISCKSNINDRKIIKSALLNEHNASIVNTEYNGSKSVIIYYSWSGNTEILVNSIKDITGADIYKITTKIPYPSEYKEALEQVKNDISSNKLPELNGSIDLSKYDTIILGYPIWIGDMALPMKSFINNNDLSDKKIAPFIVNGGSRVDKSISYIKEICTNSVVLEALSINRKNIYNSDAQVKKWINRIKIDKL